HGAGNRAGAALELAARAARDGCAGGRHVHSLAAQRVQYERTRRRPVDVDVEADDRAARVERAEPAVRRLVTVRAQKDAAAAWDHTRIGRDGMPERQLPRAPRAEARPHARTDEARRLLVRPAAVAERVCDCAAPVPPAEREPRRLAARPGPVPARSRRPAARVHPADPVRPGEVVVAPVRTEALAVHGDAVWTVEPVDAMASLHARGGNATAAKPALADRVVLGDDL